MISHGQYGLHTYVGPKPQGFRKRQQFTSWLDFTDSRIQVTNQNVGGKYYTDVNGVVQFAAAGVGYVHHAHDGSAWTPRGFRSETGRVNKLNNGWNISATGAGNWARNKLTTVSGPTTFAGISCYKIEEDNTAGQHNINQTFALSNTSCAVSAVVAPAERTWCYLSVVATVTLRAYVNLSTGAVGTLSAGATCTASKLADGAWKIEVKFTGLTAGAGAIATVNTTTGDNTSTHTGVTGSGIYVGPVILVDGASEVGSLIPAAGTRTADTASISSAFLNGIKGAGFIDFDLTPNAASSPAVRAAFDVRSGTNGFSFYIDTAGKLSTVWNNVGLQSAALTWNPFATYPGRIKWVGPVVSLYQNRDAAASASATISALSTINATAVLGMANDNTRQFDGSLKLIAAGPL